MSVAHAAEHPAVNGRSGPRKIAADTPKMSVREAICVLEPIAESPVEAGMSEENDSGQRQTRGSEQDSGNIVDEGEGPVVGQVVGDGGDAQRLLVLGSDKGPPGVASYSADITQATRG